MLPHVDFRNDTRPILLPDERAPVQRRPWRFDFTSFVLGSALAAVTSGALFGLVAGMVGL